MTAIDFARSYMRWFRPANNVRILIDAACTLIDDNAGTTESYYLIAPCRGEDTYGKRYLTNMPGYEFCGVWGERDSRTLRFAWASHNDRHRYSDGADTLEIRRFKNTRTLTNPEAVYQATMDSSDPIVCRTTIHNERRGLTAVLEYPCNTMNAIDTPMRFQVDTGPLIIPDFTLFPARPVEMMDVAYVVFNRFDEAEFVVRKPAPITDGNRTLFYRTDYAELRSYRATNEVLIAE